MNVLVVHCSKGIYGGAEVVIVKLAQYLHKHGHRVKIVAKDIPIALHYDLPDAVSLYRENTYWGLRSVVQRLIGWADVINFHNFPATLTMFPIRTKTRSVVWMCNEPAELFTTWWRKPIEAFNRWWVKSSKMGVAVADDINADRFEKIYKVKPRIIHYGVDYDFWSSGASIAKDKSSVRLLHVGTISPYKNQLRSLNTFVALLYKGVDAYITFAGSFTDEKYHNQVMEFKRYDTDSRITFLGQQSNEQVRDLFNNHDVLLHPVKGQGGWLVPFEAMCAGLPIVTVPDFPASKIIRDNQLGIVTNQVTKAIASHQYEALNTGMISRWVKDNLTWDKFGKEMLDAYQANIGK